MAALASASEASTREECQAVARPTSAPFADSRASEASESSPVFFLKDASLASCGFGFRVYEPSSRSVGKLVRQGEFGERTGRACAAAGWSAGEPGESNVGGRVFRGWIGQFLIITIMTLSLFLRLSEMLERSWNRVGSVQRLNLCYGEYDHLN